MKKLANLKGAKALSSIEQKSINGGMLKKGGGCCNPATDCCVPNDGAPRPDCPTPSGNSSCQFLYSPGACCF